MNLWPLIVMTLENEIECGIPELKDEKGVGNYAER